MICRCDEAGGARTWAGQVSMRLKFERATHHLPGDHVSAGSFETAMQVVLVPTKYNTI